MKVRSVETIVKALNRARVKYLGGGGRAGADRRMNEGVFIGPHPGLTSARLDYMIERITEFDRSK